MGGGLNFLLPALAAAAALGGRCPAGTAQCAALRTRPPWPTAPAAGVANGHPSLCD